NMNFYGPLALIGKGGYGANIHNSPERFGVEASSAQLHAVNPIGRQHLVAAIDVGSGDADGSASACTTDDLPAQLIGTFQKLPYEIQFSLLHVLPDQSAADWYRVGRLGRDHSYCRKKCGNIFFQKFGGSFTVMSKVKVEADYDLPRGQLFVQNPLDKLSGGCVGNPGIEANGEQNIHTGLFDQLTFERVGSQQTGRVFRTEDGDGMILKCENDRFPGTCFCSLNTF